MKGAKPASKITEVVDDMLDAVAGAEPLVFVKPNVSDDQWFFINFVFVLFFLFLL